MPSNSNGFSKQLRVAVEFQRKQWQVDTEYALQQVEADGVTIIRPDKSQFSAKVEAMLADYQTSPLGDTIRAIGEVR